MNLRFNLIAPGTNHGVKLLALAALVGITGAARLAAAPVAYGFSGHITTAVDSSNTVAGVTVGTPFTGTITYDPALTKQPSDTPSPHTEYYSFTNAPGFSAVVQIASHIFVGAANNPNQNGIIMYDNFSGEDSISLWFNPSETQHNGVTPSAEFTHGGFGLRFIDYSQTAFTSDALPTAPPSLGKFNPSEIWLTLYKQGTPALYYLRGTITAITASFQPRLNIRRLPNGDVQLVWPLAATGFTLESRGQLNSGTWEPVVQIAVATDTEYVVTLSAADATRLFRLVKTN